MRYSEIKIVEYGPHDRYAKVGDTTVRANTRTGKQSVNTKVGNLELCRQYIEQRWIAR